MDLLTVFRVAICFGHAWSWFHVALSLIELVLCVVVVAVLLFCVILVVLGDWVVTSCSLGEFPFCVQGVCRAIFMRLFPW